MMEVVAPATLSEGYTFDVDIEGTTTSVTVPKGGVEEGQSFTIPMPPQHCKSDCHESMSPWDSGEMEFAIVASMACVIITCGHRGVVV